MDDELPRWLMDARHDDDGGASFVGEFAKRLGEAGVPLWRTSCALMTKHPEVLWRTVQWRNDADLVVRDQAHARLDDPFYTRSPVALARRQDAPVRVRLADGDDGYPICADLRAEGGTDYEAHGLPFANGQVGYVSYATRAPGGFTETARALLGSLRPYLARRLELESAYHATRALLDVYLGRNAARRVFAGAFQRGRGELIDAALWFSDMRDFTALSDRTAPADVVETLDVYFDVVASSIAAHGGEVLKFIGDAVLAIFPVGDDARAACRHALDASREAFSALDRVNEARVANGTVPIHIGAALHRGLVMYGNIGARDRLDFTVIGAAVNEASRLEGLCKTLGTRLTLSDAFVRAADAGSDVVDLGAHALKGVRAPLQVSTLRSFAPAAGRQG